MLEHIDLGGGLGIRYKDEAAPSVHAYLQPMLDELKNRRLKLILEPGRRLVGNAGVLLTRVEYLKPGAYKNFAIIDAAMNDLARVALYDAWHDIVPVSPRDGKQQTWEIVGPICESSDFLGHDRLLALVAGDLLAVMSAGAYGMAMSSNYNARPRVAEVMVDGAATYLIRRRETAEELYALESMLPELQPSAPSCGPADALRRRARRLYGRRQQTEKRAAPSGAGDSCPSCRAGRPGDAGSGRTGGSVRNRRAQIARRWAGRQTVLYADGQHVKRGDVLLRLDPADFAARVSRRTPPSPATRR